MAASALAVVIAVAILEFGVRAWMPQLPFTEPAHDVLFLAPDPAVGWKHVENLDFYWNGRNPYCIEFRVQISTNRFGFRDRDWTLDKAPRLIRIAVLGDSFIEAIQVPWEQTAPRHVEARLASRFPRLPIETLNFGVSNYGLGQYLMVYEHYVRQFRPDYVVVFASYLNFTRTTQRELSSRLQEFYALNVRPSYTLDVDGRLIYVPAEDYIAYERGVGMLVRTNFARNRTKTVAPLRSLFALPHAALHLVSRKARPAPTPHRRTSPTFPDVELNYRILAALNSRVQADGGTLLFADAFEYLERYGLVRGSGALARRNQAFITGIGAGYVDVSYPLRASPSNPQYECDMHFNETGNRIVGETVASWFERRWGGSM